MSVVALLRARHFEVVQYAIQDSDVSFRIYQPRNSSGIKLNYEVRLKSGFHYRVELTGECSQPHSIWIYCRSTHGSLAPVIPMSSSSGNHHFDLCTPVTVGDQLHQLELMMLTKDGCSHEELQLQLQQILIIEVGPVLHLDRISIGPAAALPPIIPGRRLRGRRRAIPKAATLIEMESQRSHGNRSQRSRRKVKPPTQFTPSIPRSVARSVSAIESKKIQRRRVASRPPPARQRVASPSTRRRRMGEQIKRLIQPTSIHPPTHPPIRRLSPIVSTPRVRRREKRRQPPIVRKVAPLRSIRQSIIQQSDDESSHESFETA